MTINRHLKLHGIMKFYIIVYSTYVANLKCPLNLQYRSFLLRMVHGTKLYLEEVHHVDF